MLESVFFKEIKEIKNINFIDIRSVEKYNNNHIPNSINIPTEKLLANYTKYLDKNKKYYIYCKGGVKSRKVVNILLFYGYDVTLVY